MISKHFVCPRVASELVLELMNIMWSVWPDSSLLYFHLYTQRAVFSKSIFITVLFSFFLQKHLWHYSIFFSVCCCIRVMLCAVNSVAFAADYHSPVIWCSLWLQSSGEWQLQLPFKEPCVLHHEKHLLCHIGEFYSSHKRSYDRPTDKDF